MSGRTRILRRTLGTGAFALLAACGSSGGRAACSDFVVAARRGSAATLGAPAPAPDLVLASVDGASAPRVLPNTTGGTLYVASGDGAHVLLRVPDAGDPAGALRAVATADGAVAFASPADEHPRAIAPLFGWFPGQPTNLFYAHEDVATGAAQYVADVDLGGATHAHLRDLPPGFALVDVRISPDGSRALLRSENLAATSRCDVISTATGALVGGDLPVLPAGVATPMPRWLPDSSGLTFVDPGASSDVFRIDQDGGGLGVLYTAPSAVLDAVVAPGFAAATASAARVAYLRVAAGPTTLFGVDAVGGGARTEVDLAADLDVAEMAWHPDGATVWCQVGPTAGPASTRVFDATTAAIRRTIAAPLGALDVDRVRGDVLLWMPSAVADPQFPAAGLWHLDGDGGGGTPVSLAGWIPAGPARFLASWRNAAADAAGALVR